jgi:hypothetical protein
VAFNAVLFETAGGTADDSGIFRGDGATITAVAREGQPAPGGNGRFDHFAAGFRDRPPDSRFTLNAPSLNAAGEVAFLGALTGTAGGTADDRGVYFYDDARGLIELAREGKPFMGGTLSLLDFYANTLSGHAGEHGLNDRRQVAFSYRLTDGSAGVAVATIPAALPGDANVDGRVDRLDLEGLRAGFLSATDADSWQSGDFDRSGSTTIADFGVLRAQFGAAAPGVSANLTDADWAALAAFGASVPEPSAATAALAAAAAAVGLTRRRRRRDPGRAA